ncbi:AMP-binding protein [Marinibaculum pumilum]|uniref:AMP-binding protein n=1 Tax=Marinibaculum pumilum TaxID=1766165 RepID=A0ABV7KV96_9PROT
MSALTQSHVRGRTDVPLLDMTIGQNFEEVAARHGNRDALVVRHQDIRWSYAEMNAKADQLAAALVAQGLTKGDRIGIWSPNRYEWVLTQYATAKVGLVLVNINPAYRVSELDYALNKVGCKALILSPQFKTSNYVEMVQSLIPELDKATPGALESARFPALKMLIQLGPEPAPGMLSFDEVMSRADEGRAEAEKLAQTLTPDDPINIQFTSGTTGSPKGATLTHRNILNNGYFIGEYMKLGPEDRLCIPVPLYHCFGMVLGNLACTTHGSAMIYPDEAFEPGAVLKTVQEEKCTALHGVPTMFIAELAHPDFKSFDLSSLRTGIMAGSPCPMEVMKRVVSEMHMSEVTIAYGMTETSPVSFMSTTADPLERRVSTVGRIFPHLEVKAVDGDGNVVPVGQPGELCTRGYSVMKGYWNDEERTAESIDADGFMHTGDLGTIDAEGYCNIVGRVKDMIIRGGENVYPREVEEFLYRHPKIADVQCFGVPDERFGEELCAWVVLKPGETADQEEIRDFCRGQIAHYKIPRYVKFVEAFPMTVTGKAQKFVMREQMTGELGLKEAQTA